MTDTLRVGTWRHTEFRA